MITSELCEIRQLFQTAAARWQLAASTTGKLASTDAEAKAKLLAPALESAHADGNQTVEELSAKLKGEKATALRNALCFLGMKSGEALKMAKELAVATTSASLDDIQQRASALAQVDQEVKEALRDAQTTFDILLGQTGTGGGNLWDALSRGEGNLLGGLVIGGVSCAVLVWLAHGISKGNLLSNLTQIETARGLLTLLVGMGTVLVGSLIVIGMWLGDGDAESERKFRCSKEIFALMMSVLGTVLGFYYGSDKGHAGPREVKLEVTAPQIVRTAGVPANGMIAATISGGKPPYLYALVSTNPTISVTNISAASGIILHNFSNASVDMTIAFALVVTDAATNQISARGQVPAVPK